MFIYLLTSGITTGALYALMALGIVLIYRATGHLNFAQGEFFMIAGFVAYSLIQWAHLPYPVALLLTVPLVFLLGVACDRLVFRPLMDAPVLTVVLGTVGLSYLLKGIGRHVWGGKGEYLTIPPIIDPAPIFIAGVPILSQQLIVLGASVGFMLLFALFFRFTAAGRMMEATAENRTAAYLVGIKVKWVYTLTWGVGAAAAGVAAVLMAPLTLLTPDIGSGLLLKAFAAVIIGGLGSMGGAVIGGLIVGLTETFASGYIDSSVQQVSAFVLIMVVLVTRPHGLFGKKGGRRA